MGVLSDQTTSHTYAIHFFNAIKKPLQPSHPVLQKKRVNQKSLTMPKWIFPLLNESP